LATIFLEIIFVIRSSIHTARTFNGLPARATMRSGASWNAVVCFQLEGSDYQPKQDRNMDSELDI
jgi:hypothetical protein